MTTRSPGNTEHVVSISSEDKDIWDMENYFPNEFWKMKILKVCGAKKPKKAIYECLRHQILLKVGTLLHFSRCYTVVRQKLKLGLVTWFQISKNQFLKIDTPGPTLTCTYWRASLQCFFRDYYLLRNASKLDVKNRSCTFSKSDISSN